MSDIDDLARAAQARRVNHGQATAGDICERCRALIDVTQTPHLWHQRVVCPRCFGELSQEPPQQVLAQRAAPPPQPYYPPPPQYSPPPQYPPAGYYAPPPSTSVYVMHPPAAAKKSHPLRTIGAILAALSIPVACVLLPVAGLMFVVGVFFLLLSLAFE